MKTSTKIIKAKIGYSKYLNRCYSTEYYGDRVGHFTLRPDGKYKFNGVPVHKQERGTSTPRFPLAYDIRANGVYTESEALRIVERYRI